MQEYLLDIAQTVEKLILSAVRHNRSDYIKSLKTFKFTRLNRSLSQFTTLAVIQVYKDLATLCYTLDSKLFESEIEWLETRVKDIERMHAINV